VNNGKEQGKNIFHFNQNDDRRIEKFKNKVPFSMS